MSKQSSLEGKNDKKPKIASAVSTVSPSLSSPLSALSKGQKGDRKKKRKTTDLNRSGSFSSPSQSTTSSSAASERKGGKRSKIKDSNPFGPLEANPEPEATVEAQAETGADVGDGKEEKEDVGDSGSEHSLPDTEAGEVDLDRTAPSGGGLDGTDNPLAPYRLDAVNKIRKLYMRDELSFTTDNLEWVMSDDFNPTEQNPAAAFFDDEWADIQEAVAKAKAKASIGKRRHESPHGDELGDSFQSDSEDEEKKGNDDDEDHPKTPDHANQPLRVDVAALLPPTWVGPDQPHVKETTVQKDRREKAAPSWSKVPMIPDIKERRKLLRQHAFHIDSKGVATRAGVKMPASLDPSKDLKKQGVSKKQDTATSLVCEMLTKDWPLMVTRGSDVIRVVLTMLNGWENRSKDDIHDWVLKVVLPLLIDNNLRATDSMNRSTIKIAYPQAGKLPDEPSRSSSSAQTPLMQQMIAENTEHQDLEKAMKKAMPSSRGSTTYRGRGRGSSFKRSPFVSRPNSSSSSSSSSYRGSSRGGRGSSSSFRRPTGRGSGRGGGNKSLSSSASNEDSSI